VYIDPEWVALRFAVVDSELPDGAAGKLQLNHRPPPSDLVTLLERSPPGDETTARKWFEILSDCVSGRRFYLLGSDFLFSLPRRFFSRFSEALRHALRTRRVHRRQGIYQNILSYSVLLGKTTIGLGAPFQSVRFRGFWHTRE
jgi:hypothetical protein